MRERTWTLFPLLLASLVACNGALETAVTPEESRETDGRSLRLPQRLPADDPAGGSICTVDFQPPARIAVADVRSGAARPFADDAFKTCVLDSVDAWNSRISYSPGLQPVAYLDQLEYLACYSYESYQHTFSSIAGIEQLSGLRWAYLNPAGTGSIDLRPIGLLSRLEQLALVGPKFKRLDGLVCNHSVRDLALHEVAVTDLAPIARLTSLEGVSFREIDHPLDLTPLRNATQVRYVSLTLPDPAGLLWQLPVLPNLEMVMVWPGQYPYAGTSQELFAIGQLPKLKYLSLSGLNVRDLSFLSNLHNLESLSLPDNSIMDVGLLSNLVALKHLSLAGNWGLVDVGPLASLVNLESLVLAGTRVESIQPFTGLSKLQYLNLNSLPMITDIRPLYNLNALTYLALDYGWQVPCWQYEDMRALHPALYIEADPNRCVDEPRPITDGGGAGDVPDGDLPMKRPVFVL
jgi:hypothetical protein